MDYLFKCLVITGGIGSGKSSVLSLFEENGYHVINVDKLAHSILNSSSPYYLEYATSVDKAFGTNYKNEDKIERDTFRKKLSTTENGFEIAKNLAFPFLIKLMINEHEKAIYNKEKFVFEVPLLIETHLEKNFEKVLVVIADENIRQERIKIRNSLFTDKEIKQIMDLQATDKQRLAIADYFIDNSGTQEELKKQVQLFFNDPEQCSIDKFISKTHFNI